MSVFNSEWLIQLYLRSDENVTVPHVDLSFFVLKLNFMLGVQLFGGLFCVCYRNSLTDCGVMLSDFGISLLERNATSIRTTT